MESFTIRPILGMRTNVPQNSPLLFADGNVCHCVTGVNFDLIRNRTASTKSPGFIQWSNSANAQATLCLGLFELKGSADTDYIFFDNGQMYVFDSAKDPDEIDHSTPLNMGTDGLYSMVQVGDHIIFSDFGTNTPYCWKNGDSNFEEVIASGTEYKFRYLEYFQNFLFGAYSAETNGDIEIRWSNQLPVPGKASGDLTFAAANQLYKPGNDSITGIKRFGTNACFLYGSESIATIDYYDNFLRPFAIKQMVANQGAANADSIVDTGGRHFLFNKNYGFCEYRGGIEFPFGGRPISEPIEDTISTIDPAYYSRIQGVFLPQRNEVAWTVPLNGSLTPTHILFFNILDGSWRLEDKVAYYIDNWTITDSLIWDGASYDLADLGIVTWADFGGAAITSYIDTNPRVTFANTDGHLYYRGGEDAAGSNIDGYRIEPILDFGQPENLDLLLEIWFDITERGSFNIYVEHRGGRTVTECENASWVTLPEVSCNDPANAVCYTDKAFRFHQLKWGTDAKDERFGVNAIEFRYVREGRY